MKFRLQPYVGDNAQKTLDDGRQCTETVWGTDKGPISGKSNSSKFRQHSLTLLPLKELQANAP